MAVEVATKTPKISGSWTRDQQFALASADSPQGFRTAAERAKARDGADSEAAGECKSALTTELGNQLRRNRRSGTVAGAEGRMAIAGRAVGNARRTEESASGVFRSSR